MALFLANNTTGRAAAVGSSVGPTTRRVSHFTGPHLLPYTLLPLLPRRRHPPLQLVSASRRGKTRRTTTKEQQKEEEELRQWRSGLEGGANGMAFDDDDDDEEGLEVPEMYGLEPDFWEGEQWDGLGFFIQYMWAFGVLFALVACGIAVVTYNGGASDFKETPAYQESVQSRDLFEVPEGSNADVFEANPTEVAPSLE